MFYTLTLTIENPEGFYPKVWTCFRSKFNSFYKHQYADPMAELKGMQYIVQSHKNKKYYIFVSNNMEFLLKIKNGMEDLITDAEKMQQDILKHYFIIGKIVNP
jgi:hypothetical protein